MTSNTEEKRYKVIVVGDSNVGKTALFWRFIDGEFIAEKDTQVTTIDFKMKNIRLRNQAAKLYIWDTAGQSIDQSLQLILKAAMESLWSSTSLVRVPSKTLRSNGMIFVAIKLGRQ